MAGCFYLLLNVTILRAQESCSSSLCTATGEGQKLRHLPSHRPPRRSQEHCNLYTRRDLHWVPRRGWVRGFTLHSDTPRCGQLLSVSCPEAQTPSLPLQGLKAAAVVCTEEERRSLGSYEWGCKQGRTEENPSQGGSHSNQGFQSRNTAPLSCQTSFTKHKFKRKTKDFKTGRSGCWTPTESSGRKATKPALMHVKTPGLCSHLQDAR